MAAPVKKRNTDLEDKNVSKEIKDESDGEENIKGQTVRPH